MQSAQLSTPPTHTFYHGWFRAAGNATPLLTPDPLSHALAFGFNIASCPDLLDVHLHISFHSSRRKEKTRFVFFSHAPFPCPFFSLLCLRASLLPVCADFLLPSFPLLVRIHISSHRPPHGCIEEDDSHDQFHGCRNLVRSFLVPEGSQKETENDPPEHRTSPPFLCQYQSSQLFSTVSRTRLVYSFRLSL